MFGLYERDYKKPKRVFDILDIEDAIMRQIMIDEKMLASYCSPRVVPNAATRTAIDVTYNRLLSMKGLLYSFILKSGNCVMSEEAKSWFAVRPLDEYEYLGPWCNFWFKWREESFYDQKNRRWILPVSSPAGNLFLRLASGECDDCMFECLYKNKGNVCLCGVRDNIDDLPAEEKRACSHYIRDTYDAEDDEGGDTEDENSQAELYFERRNKRHEDFFKSQGSPKFEKEGASLFSVEELNRLQGFMKAERGDGDKK